MLEVYLLGRGGMVPLPGRFLTSLLVRCQGKAILVDCGESTQVAVRKAGQGFKQIGTILLTHFHADHVAGLPGLLLTIGNSGREEPLLVVGPKHVGQVCDCLRVIAPQLPFEVRYLEVPEDGGDVLEEAGVHISALPVEHWIPCYGYRFDLPRQGKFSPDKAKALEVPVVLWRQLQQGESVQLEGREVTSEQVMGPPRKGLSLCYATDLRPSVALSGFASGANLFVCEGMYGEPDALDKAVEHRHCMFVEAARMAKAANAGELWLTHFSPSMPDPENYLVHARDIFGETYIDRDSTVLQFRD